MSVNYTRVMQALCAHPWAILKSKLDAICAVIELRANGGVASKDEIRAAMQAAPSAGLRLEAGGAVAVIPLSGCIMHRANMFTDFSGGTSLEHFRNQLRKAVVDQSVKAIVIDIDSPGGSTYMLEETAAEIVSARKAKRVTAVVNPLMASAALWLGSQADEVAGSPSCDAGSLGIYCAHADWSKANEEMGVKVTYIKSDISPFKVESNPDEPLADDAQQYIQDQVNALGAKFVKAVASGRGLQAAHVRAQFGQGRTLFAEDALKAKMIDRIATLDETIERVGGRKGRSQVALASLADDVAAQTDSPAVLAGDTTEEAAAVDADAPSEALSAQRDRDRVLAAITVMEIEYAQSSDAA